MTISFQGQRIRTLKIKTVKICAKCKKRKVPKHTYCDLLCAKCMREFIKGKILRFKL